MRIRAGHIYQFGKWRDLSFSFDSNLQAVIGGNGSGKTTLKDFILQILFGFSYRGQGNRDYTPQGGGSLAGSLDIDTDSHGQIRLERVQKSSANGDLIVRFEDGREGGEEEWQEVLGGVDRDWYRYFYQLDLSALSSNQQMPPEDLNAFYLNQGVLGTDRYQKMKVQLQEEADALYRPRARVRPINQKIREMRALEEEINKKEQENAGYQQVLDQRKQLKKEVKLLEKDLDQDRQQLNKLRTLATSWSDYERVKNGANYPKIKRDERLENDYQSLVFLDKRLQAQKKKKQDLEDLASAFEGRYKGGQRSLQQQKKQVQTLMDQLDRGRKLDRWISEIDQERQETADKMGITTQQVQDLAQVTDLVDSADLSQAVQQLQSLRSERDQVLVEMADSESDQTGTSPGANDRSKHALTLSLVTMVVSFILLFLRTYALAAASILICLVSLAFAVIANQRNKKESLFDQRANRLSRLTQEEKELLDQAPFTVFSNQVMSLDQVYPYREDLGRDLRLLQKKNKFSQDKDQLTKEISRAYQDLDGIEFSGNMDQAYSQLESALKNMDSNQEKNKPAVKDDLYAIDQAIIDLKAEKQIILDRYHVADSSNLAQLHDQAQAKLRQQEDRDQLIRQLPYPTAHFEQYESQEQLQAQIQASIQVLDQKKNQVSVLEDQLLQVEVEIKHLETDGSYDQVLQEFEMMRSQLAQLVAEWQEKIKQIHLIDECLSIAQEGYIPQLIEELTALFNRLTLGHYQQVYFVKGTFRFEDAAGQRFNLEDLSQGGQDQFFVAFRLSFILSMSVFYELPLLVDDSFVNFDAERKKVMYDVLKEVSKRIQVIYFSTALPEELVDKNQVIMVS